MKKNFLTIFDEKKGFKPEKKTSLETEYFHNGIMRQRMKFKVEILTILINFDLLFME